MLLLSCLLVLRVQQDRYAEVVHWRGGVPDMGNPFPWELHPLVAGDDKFESTFLSPILRKASTFLKSPAEASMLISGLPRTVVTGGHGSTSKSGASQMLGISAVTSSADFPPPICLGNGSTCYMGLQRTTNVPVRARLQLLSGSDGAQYEQKLACHRFLAGGSPMAMRPFPADSNRSQLLCMRSTRIQALVPTRSNGSTIVAWEYMPLMQTRQPRLLKSSPACVAAMSPGDLRISASMLVGSASTVLYDQGTNLFITIGYSSVQTLIVNVFEPETLKPLLKYRLPLEVAWLLRARLSDGFLLFVGAQEPFLGTVFTIDLKQKQVFEQDPPAVGSVHTRRPRRRRLPRSMVLEMAPDGSASGLSERCAAVAVADRQGSLKLKGDPSRDGNQAGHTGEKAGPSDDPGWHGVTP